MAGSELSPEDGTLDGTLDGTTTPSPFAVDFNLRLIFTADLPATATATATVTAGSGPSLGDGTPPSPFAVDFNLRLIFTADLPATAPPAAGSGPSLGDGPPLISLGDIRNTQSLYNNNNHTHYFHISFSILHQRQKTNTKKIEIVFQVMATSSHTYKRIYNDRISIIIHQQQQQYHLSP
jgi:hypothetical protein